MAFEIGPREQVQKYAVAEGGLQAGHTAEIHSRVINGKKFVFGRFDYDNGLLAVQAIVPGEMRKGSPDIHYWTNRDEE
ncbi:hypothetical protein ACOB87_38115 [Streptomyces sp. YS-B37]|uniref:hypothetical protein n=1 Tax=Streptomyces sp. YS-B37 TaxID=3407669 RepID=UPI003B510CEB